MRSSAMKDSVKLMGPAITRFNILDYSPKKAPPSPPSKKNLNKQKSFGGSLYGMSMSNNLALEDDEDEEENEAAQKLRAEMALL